MLSRYFFFGLFSGKKNQQNIQIPNTHNYSYICFLFLEITRETETYDRITLCQKVIGYVGAKAHTWQI